MYRMSWKNIFRGSGIPLPPRTRIAIYLLDSMDEDGFIVATISKAATMAHTSYATAQKVFKELIDTRHIAKIRNGLYVPVLCITNRSPGEVNGMISKNEIGTNVDVFEKWGGIYICPRKAAKYLKEPEKAQQRHEN